MKHETRKHLRARMRRFRKRHPNYAKLYMRKWRAAGKDRWLKRQKKVSKRQHRRKMKAAGLCPECGRPLDHSKAP